MRTLRRLVLIGVLAGLGSGCIAIIERGTRGGRITPLGSVNISKGDSRDDVLAKLGEPDEIATISSDTEAFTYKSVDGFYILVFGKFEYFTLRVELSEGRVSRVQSQQMGKDMLILTGYSAGTQEPSR